MSEPGPLMKELGRLEAAKRAAEQRRGELDAARHVKVRQAEMKKSEIAALEEQYGATGERDELRLAQLLEELRELESGMTVRLEEYPGMGPRAELVDERAEAAWIGAQSAVVDAENALRDFAREHLAGVMVEIAPDAEQVRQKVEAWLREGERLAGVEQGYTSLSARLCVLANREELIGTLPPSPLEALRDAVRVVRLPLPEAFWGDR
jgi:hypothetical protein